MSTPKSEVAAMLEALPESSTFEDIQYHLYVLEKVNRGLERAAADSDRNPLESLEMFQALIESLLEEDPAIVETALDADAPNGKVTADDDASADVISVPRFWNTIAQTKRDDGKLKFLSSSDRIKLIAERMTIARAAGADALQRAARLTLTQRPPIYQYKRSIKYIESGYVVAINDSHSYCQISGDAANPSRSKASRCSNLFVLGWR